MYTYEVLSDFYDFDSNDEWSAMDVNSWGFDTKAEAVTHLGREVIESVHAVMDEFGGGKDTIGTVAGGQVFVLTPDGLPRYEITLWRVDEDEEQEALFDDDLSKPWE